MPTVPQVYLVLGVASLIVALLVMVRRPTERRATLFVIAALCMFAGLGQLVDVLWSTQAQTPDWLIRTLASACFTAAGALYVRAAFASPPVRAN